MSSARPPEGTPVNEQAGDKPAQRPSSFWRTVRAVAWSFIGVRRGSEFQQDIARISPYQVIAVGIAGALVFVGSLMMLVRWVVA